MTLARAEVHTFRGINQEFAYLVPSGGIIALNGISSELLARLEQSPQSREELIDELAAKGYAPEAIRSFRFINCWVRLALM